MAKLATRHVADVNIERDLLLEHLEHSRAIRTLRFWCPSGTPCDALAQTRGRQTCSSGMRIGQPEWRWTLVLDAGSEKEIAHALVTGDATLDDGGQRLSLTALNSSTGTSRRRGGVQGTRTGLHSSILLNCLLLVLPLVIRAELFPSVRRSIVWVDTSASRHPHLP